jgi:hypothetical protein
MIRRSKGALLMGGVAIGLALLVDVRGLLFALAALGMVLLGALRASPRKVPLRLALVLLPIWGSWGLAQQAFPEGAQSLERQVKNLDAHLKARRQLGDAFPLASTSYVWGTSSPLAIPESLKELRHQTQVVATLTRDSEVRKGAVNLYIRPWEWPALLSLGLVLWGFRRRPWHFLALGLSVLPALAVLRTVSMTEVRLRFLGAVAPAMAVLMGIAFATLLSLRARKPEVDGEVEPSRSVPSREGLGLLVLGGLILGFVPSWLGPQSPRTVEQSVGQVGLALEHAANMEWSKDESLLRAQFTDLMFELGEPASPSLFSCKQHLFEDQKAGHSIGGSVFR